MAIFPQISTFQCLCLVRLLAALLSITVVQRGLAAPTYRITPVGLAGPEHTRDDGYIFNRAMEFNEAGSLLGSAKRFNGGNIDLGQSLWLFNGNTTRNIGLTASEHTRNDGYRFSDFEGVSSPNWLNESGQVAGYSRRYSGGSTDLGRSAWLYDGSTTREIGPLDAEHTRDDGYRYNYATRINEAGKVVGGSFRYNGGNTQLGFSAWLFDGTNTTRIGLQGPEFTRADGYQFVSAGQLNEAGQVTGGSWRYNGGNEGVGFSAWFFNGSNTIELGLTGSHYIGSGDLKASSIRGLNEAGQIVGSTDRFNGGSERTGIAAWFFDGTTTRDISLPGEEASVPLFLNEAGQVLGLASRFGDTTAGRPWLYNGVTTIAIGPKGVEHTRAEGPTEHFVWSLSESGFVIGSTPRHFGGFTQLGNTAWLYNGVTTINIGLVGPEHTQTAGERWSRPDHLNDAGQVIGKSTRYNGNAQSGDSAWLYNGSTTIELGLTGSKYTRNDGYENSGAFSLNSAGQVLGSTQRFDLTGPSSESWLYDPLLGYIPFEFSSRSDGYWNSSPQYLGDDGLVLGSYTLFDASDNNLGSRAFYFTIAEGMYDLGALVEGGISANGWDSLANAIRTIGHGRILGHGKLTAQSGGQMAYLLTPATSVPEPSTLLLTASALVPFSWRRRRVRNYARMLVLGVGR